MADEEQENQMLIYENSKIIISYQVFCFIVIIFSILKEKLENLNLQKSIQISENDENNEKNNILSQEIFELIKNCSKCSINF